MRQVISKQSLYGLQQITIDLCSKEERKTAFALIDFYYQYATCMEDYEIIGAAALRAEHRDIYLKCAESSYAMASETGNNEILFNSRVNLYKAYSAMNYPEKALFYINLNLEAKPDDFETKLNYAFNIGLMGRKEESEAMIEGLLATNPEEEKNIRFSLSGKMLRDGKTGEGIRNFIDAFKPRNELFEDQLNMRKWTGTIVPGETIYVNGEGGIGDEVINIRFFKHLRDLGMNPILYSPWAIYRPDMVDVFERHGYEVITDTYSIRRECMWTNLMSIPGYLDVKESDLWHGQYLFPLNQKKNILDSKKFKIGIKCNGNPYFSQDVYRQVPIEKMLQYIPENAEIYYFDKEKSHDKTINMKDRLGCWDDTMDLINQMDVILTSCTSLAHVSGAMDKKTLVVIPITEYYTWTSSRKDGTTPWYSDNVKLLKQSVLRSWDEPLQEANKILTEMMKEHNNV